MRKSTDHILTSQAGSLPRPDDLIEMNRAKSAGEAVDDKALAALLRSSVADVVRRQVDLGIDVPGDGELGKATTEAVDYGAWWFYSFQRVSGLGVYAQMAEMPLTPVRSANVSFGTFLTRRDREIFAEAYNDVASGIAARRRSGLGVPVCEGPLVYTGQALLQADIDNFKAALKAAGAEEGFMCAIGPGSAARVGNRYYASDEEHVWAWAEAMRSEYKAIVDAGLILQIDDPCIAENWDQVNPEPALEEYKKFTMVRVEAMNHALRGIPQDRVRFHLCWGSWHGPHTTDLPLRDLVDVMLKINAGAYSFEAGNVRHEHEWKVWRDVKLPAGKVLIPGVVSHATNVVEHPELVADRICRFAEIVGRENVIAATDCGLGGRVHPQIAWAKLGALAEGAKLATKRLWG
jgi:5-methyltetrahydropteroyltriglutamate--homocysteine methyltransferase